MPFTDIEIAAHTELIEQRFWSKRRPALKIRDLMRDGQRIEGHSIELFFVRPGWDDPSRTTEESIAKLTFVRTSGVWRLYWKRADGKWHGYQPCPQVKSLAAALRVIDEDACCCFFG